MLLTIVTKYVYKQIAECHTSRKKKKRELEKQTRRELERELEEEMKQMQPHHIMTTQPKEIRVTIVSDHPSQHVGTQTQSRYVSTD